MQKATVWILMWANDAYYAEEYNTRFVGVFTSVRDARKLFPALKKVSSCEYTAEAAGNWHASILTLRKRTLNTVCDAGASHYSSTLKILEAQFGPARSKR